MITQTELMAVTQILNRYFIDAEELKDFEGFYDIKHELEDSGIDRFKAMKILTYLKANGQFLKVIQKMNSQYSPVECKRFELDDYDC